MANKNMKVTKQQLTCIIKEEFDNVLTELEQPRKGTLENILNKITKLEADHENTKKWAQDTFKYIFDFIRKTEA
tara:strand:+ start:284 stop:505 length:222 start_codon:yes stop_codon:yes gene_type:complete